MNYQQPQAGNQPVGEVLREPSIKIRFHSS